MANSSKVVGEITRILIYPRDDHGNVILSSDLSWGSEEEFPFKVQFSKARQGIGLTAGKYRKYSDPTSLFAFHETVAAGACRLGPANGGYIICEVKLTLLG